MGGCNKFNTAHRKNKADLFCFESLAPYELLYIQQVAVFLNIIG